MTPRKLSTLSDCTVRLPLDFPTLFASMATKFSLARQVESAALFLPIVGAVQSSGLRHCAVAQELAARDHRDRSFVSRAEGKAEASGKLLPFPPDGRLPGSAFVSCRKQSTLPHVNGARRSELLLWPSCSARSSVIYTQFAIFIFTLSRFSHLEYDTYALKSFNCKTQVSRRY